MDFRLPTSDFRLPTSEKRPFWLLLLALVLAAPLAAQLEPAPSFTVSANTNCNNSQNASTYTCAATNNLIQNWTMPTGINLHGCTLGQGGNCHFEYCFAASPPATLNSDGTITNGYCNWSNLRG
jgi:hypothetical protein